MVISRTTGSGWVMVIVSGLVAAIVIAALWPGLAFARFRLTAVAPRDGTVGRPLEVVLTGTNAQPLLLRIVEPAGEWTAMEPHGDGPVTVTPTRRGVVEELTVEMRLGAPLGLVWWRRTDRLPLAQPLEVGPEPIAVSLPPVVQGDLGELHPPQRRGGSEGVRTVRDYVPGDPARLVHWGATARRGDLMVKELEDPEGAVLAVVVDLRGREIDAELAASRAAGLCAAAIRAGVRVLLLTAEAGGPRVGPAVTAVEAGRRLARAVAAPPPDGPLPPGATVVRMAAEGGEP